MGILLNMKTKELNKTPSDKVVRVFTCYKVLFLLSIFAVIFLKVNISTFIIPFIIINAIIILVLKYKYNVESSIDPSISPDDNIYYPPEAGGPHDATRETIEFGARMERGRTIGLKCPL